VEGISVNAENGDVWVCLVCGYVHRGPEPPEVCPICGASRDEFERHAEAPVAEKPVEAPRRWRCLICGYEHAGPAPPETCPVCGASADDFEPVAEGELTAEGGGEAGRVVIVGGGIAGVSAAAAARDAAPDAEIALISKEPELPYYRLNLTRYVAGEVADEDLPIHAESWYEEQSIRLLLGTAVSAVLPEEGVVETGGDGPQPFDKLILTCGAHPYVPPFPGASREGVTSLRTAAQARALVEMATSDAPCVVIGGGILGLEAAGGLARRGVKVTVLEGHDWLLPRQLNREAGRMLERLVAGKGIAVKPLARTAEIRGDKRVEAVALADGGSLHAELVLIATGVRSNSHLARRAGLEVNQGVVVDSRLQTSHPNVLAAGDAAEHRGVVYGLWEPARYQGMIAGMNAAGLHSEFGGLPRTNTLKVLGIDLFSIGVITPEDASFTEVAEEQDGAYCRFLFKDSRLVGSILLGDTTVASVTARAVKEGRDCSSVLRKRPTASEITSFLKGG